MVQVDTTLKKCQRGIFAIGKITTTGVFGYIGPWGRFRVTRIIATGSAGGTTARAVTVEEIAVLLNGHQIQVGVFVIVTQGVIVDTGITGRAITWISSGGWVYTIYATPFVDIYSADGATLGEVGNHQNIIVLVLTNKILWAVAVVFTEHADFVFEDPETHLGITFNGKAVGTEIDNIIYAGMRIWVSRATANGAIRVATGGVKREKVVDINAVKGSKGIRQVIFVTWPFVAPAPAGSRNLVKILVKVALPAGGQAFRGVENVPVTNGIVQIGVSYKDEFHRVCETTHIGIGISLFGKIGRIDIGPIVTGKDARPPIMTGIRGITLSIGISRTFTKIAFV